MGERRVLFLRTFRDPAADTVVLGHLDAALEASDRIVLLGDERDEAALLPAAGGRAQLLATTEATWRRAVLEAMASSDAVVLHFSPKDLSFPLFSRVPDLGRLLPDEPLGKRADEVVRRTPLGRPSTGVGLLHELAYLDRLDLLGRTVAVVDNRHYLHLCRRVDEAVLSSADAWTTDGRLLTARTDHAERRLRLLRDVDGVTFSAPADGSLSEAFVDALAAALADRATRSAALPSPLPVGCSPDPRPLFPDRAPKVVAHTPVEDLLQLPVGEITEIGPARVRAALTAGSGCPTCPGPATGIFFYTHGLAPVADDADLVELGTHGLCQACGRRCTLVPNGRLAAY